MNKNNLVLHAVLLLRKIDKYRSKDEQIKLMQMHKEQEIQDFIDSFPDVDACFVSDECWNEMVDEYARNAYDNWIGTSDYYDNGGRMGIDYSPSCPWNAPGMSISDFI